MTRVKKKTRLKINFGSCPFEKFRQKKTGVLLDAEQHLSFVLCRYFVDSHLWFQ